MMTDCTRCAGTGKLISDWEGYLSPPPGATADDATEACDDCAGTGKADGGASPPRPFVPIPGQSFANKQAWVVRASRVLTGHPEYLNTEHDGPARGWRGPHFTALCFDQQGRRCRIGGDFKRAEDDGAYPIWWIWPDQIVGAIRGDTADMDNS